MMWSEKTTSIPTCLIAYIRTSVMWAIPHHLLWPNTPKALFLELIPVGTHRKISFVHSRKLAMLVLVSTFTAKTILIIHLQWNVLSFTVLNAASRSNLLFHITWRAYLAMSTERIFDDLVDRNLLYCMQIITRISVRSATNENEGRIRSGIWEIYVHHVNIGKTHLSVGIRSTYAAAFYSQQTRNWLTFMLKSWTGSRAKEKTSEDSLLTCM